MAVYLPFSHGAPTDWTLAWAQWYCTDTVLVPIGTGNHDYAEAFKSWWEEGKPFVIVEQDVVPWPGADQALFECPEPWCAMSYYMNDTELIKPPLGCAKFAPEGDVPFDAPNNIWGDFRTENGLPHWQVMDLVIAASMQARGIEVHQHFPAVAHIKPAGMGMSSVGFMGVIEKVA